jgi:hypothetical protein
VAQAFYLQSVILYTASLPSPCLKIILPLSTLTTRRPRDSFSHYSVHMARLWFAFSKAIQVAPLRHSPCRHRLNGLCVLSSHEHVLDTPPTSYESYNSDSHSHEYILQKEQLVKEVTQYSKCGTMSRIVRVKLPKPNLMISDISQDRAMNIDSDSPDIITRASSHCALFDTNKAIVRFPNLTLPPTPLAKSTYEKTLHMKTTHNSLAGSMSIHIKLLLPG